MRPKTLITMAVTGMLAVPGVPALAADWSFQQFQVTDGYDVAHDTTAVTGMPGVPALAADWSFQQLQVTDGYDAFQNYSPPPDRGAAGRPGRSAAEDTWLQGQLQRTDGYAEPSIGSGGDAQLR